MEPVPAGLLLMVKQPEMVHSAATRITMLLYQRTYPEMQSLRI